MRLLRVTFAAFLATFSSAAAGSDYSPYAGESFPRQVYWGDTHVHSSWSVDAGNTGNLRVGPGEAFRYARGEEVTGHNGMPARLRRPLDFLLLSDHAEYLGVMPRLDAGDALARSTEAGERWYGYRRDGNHTQLFAEFAESLTGGGDLLGNEPLQRAVWHDVIANADRYNAPGRFTAFIGYEWTSSVVGDNLHRNVIFRDGAERTSEIVPMSSIDSQDPENLWRFLAAYEEKTGGRVMAIPHNANLSGGLMFDPKTFDGRYFDEAYVALRARFERLVEATQYKGDSETHPRLSPDDEFADYETWNTNIGSEPNEDSMLWGSYVRSALKLGLREGTRLGANPFKLGMIGSTDAHTGLAAGAEDDFWGKFTWSEPSPDRWKEPFPSLDVAAQNLEWQMAASGYAAVWATENTREALFDAMERRETYATTGPRMVVRFFGGWGFEADDALAPDVAKTGYAGGVPMGGDLAAAQGGGAPRFLVAALRDPDGANLDRIQVVKGWETAAGELAERVYDVAVSGGRAIGADGRARQDVGSTVDVATASYANTIGSGELAAVWEDPDFDPSQPAFYYARVIEIPKPRWTAYDALYFDVEMDPEVPMTTRDRAYTSPIWYTPGQGRMGEADR